MLKHLPTQKQAYSRHSNLLFITKNTIYGFNVF